MAIWNSPSITAGAGLQVPITTVEAAATSVFVKPEFYTVQIAGNMNGEFQHVLLHSADGTFTNLTTCSTATRNNPSRVGAVHASVIGALGYPSSIIVANTGTAATTLTLDITEASSGTKLGTYQTTSIPAKGQAILAVSDIENGANQKINLAGRSHYVVIAASAFSGYIQHLVDNSRFGVVTDMTTTCSLQP